VPGQEDFREKRDAQGLTIFLQQERDGGGKCRVSSLVQVKTVRHACLQTDVDAYLAFIYHTHEGKHLHNP